MSHFPISATEWPIWVIFVFVWNVYVRPCAGVIFGKFQCSVLMQWHEKWKNSPIFDFILEGEPYGGLDSYIGMLSNCSRTKRFSLNFQFSLSAGDNPHMYLTSCANKELSTLWDALNSRAALRQSRAGRWQAWEWMQHRGRIRTCRVEAGPRMETKAATMIASDTEEIASGHMSLGQFWIKKFCNP